MKSDVEHRLILEISAGLHLTALEKGYLVSRDSMTPWCDDILKWFPVDLQEKLLRFCGGSGFQSFLYGELKGLIGEAYSWDKNAPSVLLTTLPEFSNPIGIARRVVKKLQGIPYRYRATVGLPKSFSQPVRPYFDSFELNKSTALFCAGALPQPFPIRSNVPAISNVIFREVFSSAEFEDEIIEDRVYLSTMLLGYDSPEGRSILARNLEDNARVFYGAAKALNLLSYNYVSENKHVMIMLHDETGSREIVGTEEIESDLWSSNYRFGTTGIIAEDRRTRSDFLKRQFGYIREAFGEDVPNKRLYTGCMWYFRAWSSSRPLDRLLEATIAMEVILGDRDAHESGGLGNLIGNRCAYMLGKTPIEREKILSDFKKLYKLRSSIVHVGKHRADFDEMNTVREAVDLCGKIIRNELRALSESRFH